MKKAIFLIVLTIVLVGCTPKIVYVNQTTKWITDKECAVCIECQEIPDCICNCYKPECKTDIISVITDDCTKKLNMCNIRSDFLNDELYDCMISNNTEFLENLTIAFNDCIIENEELKDDI